MRAQVYETCARPRNFTGNERLTTDNVIIKNKQSTNYYKWFTLF